MEKYNNAEFLQYNIHDVQGTTPEYSTKKDSGQYDLFLKKMVINLCQPWDDPDVRILQDFKASSINILRQVKEIHLYLYDEIDMILFVEKLSGNYKTLPRTNK